MPPVPYMQSSETTLTSVVSLNFYSTLAALSFNTREALAAKRKPVQKAPIAGPFAYSVATHAARRARELPPKRRILNENVVTNSQKSIKTQIH